MDVYEIVLKLIGPINPIGETNTDRVRYENLQQTIDLVDRLILNISHVSDNRNRPEYSLSNAGKKAYQFLQELKEDL